MTASSLKPIAILGAGSWGTALALYLGRRGQPVRIWSIEPSEIAAMIKDKAHHHFLPGHLLPDSVSPMADLTAAIESVDEILMVVPSVGFKGTLKLLKAATTKPLSIVCATKGLDAETGQLLSEVTAKILGPQDQFAMLSGPSFAREVAQGLPTAVVIASSHKSLLADLVHRFDSPLFRIDTTDDVIGVEIGGVVKNVIAIATGLSDGMGLGANARAVIITRGLNEIMRLGKALGGKEETFLGLAGLGDLILTASDKQSRNHRFGFALGEGQSLEEAERDIGQVVEGKRNAELVITRAKHYGIAMPVCDAVWRVLQGEISVREAVQGMF